MIARRRYLAGRYSEALSQFDWLVPPVEPSGLRHNYQSYMVRLKDNAPLTRDQLMQEMLDRGISTRRGIMAIHREMPYSEERWTNRFPETDSVTSNCIILPLFHTMTEEDQDYVIDCVRQLS